MFLALQVVHDKEYFGNLSGQRLEPPHTALSTKTPTLMLARSARANADTQNLANLPELLLLGGGYPIWHNGQVIGGIGVAGGGGPENDHTIAKAASTAATALLIP